MADKMPVAIFENANAAGRAAAARASRILTNAVRDNGAARVIIATGNSQIPFITALREETAVPWKKITVFHMDEYVGISADHSASFRRWLRERVVEPFGPATMHYLNGEAEDIGDECRRYEALLKEAPIDLVCLGIGENGHIAFNDPPVADFNDPVFVKKVELDEACRRQQVGEGHFSSMDDVPTHALSLTVPALLYPDNLQVVVPEARKAEAVRQALRGPVSTDCPASILRTCFKARLFLDAEAASLLD